MSSAPDRQHATTHPTYREPMGLRNLRAICPNCGGKIHTQPKGLGHITWANSWFMVKTGTKCQHCGASLTGKVKADGKAELAHPNQSAQPARPIPPPPAPTDMSHPPAHSAGWWSDPTRRYDLRYFSGSFWTNRVASADGTEGADSIPVATAR